MGQINNPFEEKRDPSIGEIKVLFSTYLGMAAAFLNLSDSEKKAANKIVDAAVKYEPNAVEVLVEAAIKRGYISR